MTTSVVPRGRPVDRLRDLLERSRDQIALALPRHLTPERMIRVALTAYQRSSDLADCDLLSIVGCVVQASQLGLELDGILGHAYLVPFRNSRTKRRESQLIVGYKGFLSLARRSGEVSRFDAHVVHDKDTFTFLYGRHADLRHTHALTERGAPVGVYAEIALRDGAYDFEVLGWDEVLAHQARYGKRDNKGQPCGPWYTDLPEMAKKTSIRRLAKRVPVSVEIQRAASLDEAAEAEVPQNLAGLVTGMGRTDSVAAQLAQKADGRPISAEQLTTLARLVRETNTEETELRGELLALFGVGDPGQLTAMQADEAIDRYVTLARTQAADAEGERAAIEAT